MIYFNPFQANPIVPSQQSIGQYTLIQTNTVFTFPTSNMVGDNFLANVMLVQSDQDGYNIVLPDARTAGIGYSFLIFNVGTVNSFKVNDSEGGTVVTNIGVNTTGIFFSLKDNTTQAGEWFVAELAVQAAIANIAANAGNGLAAQGSTNTLWGSITPVDVNTSRSLALSDAVRLINWTGGTGILTLPPLGGVYPNNIGGGYYLYIRNSSPSNGVLTLSAQPGSTINGQPTVTVTFNESCVLIMDSTGNFNTVGLSRLNEGDSVIINSNGIQVINGTSSSPSYAFISNPSLGIYTQSGNDLTFTQGGSAMAQLTTTDGFNLTAGEIYWFGVPYGYYVQCM